MIGDRFGEVALVTGTRWGFGRVIAQAMAGTGSTTGEAVAVAGGL